MRREIKEEMSLPTDLRSLRLQLEQEERSVEAGQEMQRRRVHKVGSLQEQIQIREFQEEPEKRTALEDLLHEIDSYFMAQGHSLIEASSLTRARDRVKALLDEPEIPYQRKRA